MPPPDPLLVVAVKATDAPKDNEAGVALTVKAGEAFTVTFAICQAVLPLIM